MTGKAPGGKISGAMGVLLVAGCIVVTALTLASTAYVFHNYFQRRAILESGMRTLGRIEHERYGTGKYASLVCTAVFSYSVSGKRYLGERRGCNSADGSAKTIPVAYDEGDPAKAVAVSEGPWRSGESGGPIVLAVLSLMLLAGWGMMAEQVLRKQVSRRNGKPDPDG